MRRAVVCGAGGFIGHHLVRQLKDDGFWVRGVDVKAPGWSASAADEFVVCDLRDATAALAALDVAGGTDHVYQLAADMGGMGFIHSAEADIMRNSVLINAHLIDAASRIGVGRYFYASSVCVYRDMQPGETELTEDDAYPALPDNEYGWEKLYTERMVQAFGRNHGFQTRIARFQNCYGPEGTWDGGREKAPAALCRKVAQSTDGRVEVWGDGTAVRNFVYVADLVRAVRMLVDSDQAEPTNIGTREYVTVKELLDVVAQVAGKHITPVWVEGVVGVQSRNFSNDRIESLGWQPRFPLRDGLALTYPWIAAQVEATDPDR
jgi:GDP-D-mannose 3', 5'-epimerase